MCDTDPEAGPQLRSRARRGSTAADRQARRSWHDDHHAERRRAAAASRRRGDRSARPAPRRDRDAHHERLSAYAFDDPRHHIRSAALMRQCPCIVRGLRRAGFTGGLRAHGRRHHEGVGGGRRWIARQDSRDRARRTAKVFLRAEDDGQEDGVRRPRVGWRLEV